MSIRDAGRTLTLATSCLCLLAACSNLQTRPGHPDSYAPGLSGEDYYGSALKKLEWPTSPPIEKENPQSVPSLQNKGVPIHQPPPDYLATSVPIEIWQARGAAWNLHLKYLAASYKAADVQDAFAVPVFGAAVATVALGIAKANAVPIAATGLGGASLYAGYSYLHPDKDISTDQAAAFDLVCVVDQSLPLRTMSVVPLLLDKAALQDALDQLASDSGTLMSLPSPSASDRAAQDAVTAAQSAANNAMDSLNDNINVYNSMPALIYSMMDEIDKAAQTNGARSIDFNGLVSTLQAAATDKATNTTNQKATADAQKKASVAAKSSPKSPATQQVTTPKAATTQNLGSITSGPSGAETAALAGPPAAGAVVDTGKSGTNQATATKLTATLSDPATSDLQKITRITRDANEDLQVTSYHDVAAKILVCPAGQWTAPVTIPPAAPADTSDKAGS